VVRFVRLEMIEGTSSKFHEQYVMSSGGAYLHKAVWGRIGTPGTTQKARLRRVQQSLKASDPES
jgi:predicted DNA-binding WGR domain protein